MNRIVLIVGPSGAGKDTVARMLCESHDCVQVITSTERGIRNKETQGVEHNFITHEEFNQLEKETEILAPVTIKGSRYGLPSRSLEDILNNSKLPLYVIEPSGVYWFKENAKRFNIEVLTVSLKLDLETRKERCNLRSDYDKFLDRITYETEVYAEFDKSNCTDLELYNEYSSETVLKICSWLVLEGWFK